MLSVYHLALETRETGNDCGEHAGLASWGLLERSGKGSRLIALPKAFRVPSIPIKHGGRLTLCILSGMSLMLPAGITEKRA